MVDIQSNNPYDKVLKELQVDGVKYRYYSLDALNDQRVQKLPFSIRILLEIALRNCDEFNIKQSDVEKILGWSQNYKLDIEIPFKPARVILQDFTGVPLIVDLAAMRDAMVRLGNDPKKINPLCQVDLVIDHSIQVDFAKTKDAVKQNEQIEFERNRERFQFLKWGQNAFSNLKIVPPGSGIVHQVNLEYLARSVFNENGLLYPDSVVGTDSHTTMINGLGVLGWGVGGIEAEAVMLGECTAMVLPEVIGFKFTGNLPKTSTATDLVLTCTQILRKQNVVGKFVEFFGPGVKSLTLADRATIANMAPEYGATMGFFPCDDVTIDYLKFTGRDEKYVKVIEQYLKANSLFRVYDGSQQEPIYSGNILELDLSTVLPSLAGPKRPQDRVELSKLQQEFQTNLCKPVDFKCFGVSQDKADLSVDFEFEGTKYKFKHGQIVIAAITSCTNTSNPDVMLAAGILAKNAVQKGLTVPKYVKTSLSPGSQVVTLYYEASGLDKFLDQLGFTTAGYGCMTCIGNSGEIDPILNKLINDNDFVATAVLSGNRNFEGRVHPQTKANYLSSPPLVVAFAIAGNININFETTPLGNDQNNNPVYLRDIWPSREEVQALSSKVISPNMFRDNYAKIAQGTNNWNSLQVKESVTYDWDKDSTYIHNPPFFSGKTQQLPQIQDINNAYCLGYFGDSITTDHISPAGNISANSPAGKYLVQRQVSPQDFNSYGARRGNDEVMARGTFSNTRIINKLVSKVGPNTLYIPVNKEMAFFDASQLYINNNQQTIILGGKEYGSGSSRDWAAKGPYLLGVSAVICESFERIHRSNLIGMGILPLQFKDKENAQTHNLTGKEKFSIILNNGNLKVGQDIEIKLDNGKSFNVICRLDTDVEVNYFQNGGILLYVLRKLLKN